MSIIRVQKQKRDFYIASNYAPNDSNLSWEARGMLSYLFSKPDNWEIRTNDLVAASPAGKDKTQRIINELKEAGYLHRFQSQGSNGRFETVSVLYETPDDNPYFTEKTIEKEDVTNGNVGTVTGFPGDGLSDDGNPRHIIKTELLKTYSNTDTNVSVLPDNPKPDQAPQSEQLSDLKRLEHFFSRLSGLNVPTPPQTDKGAQLKKWQRATAVRWWQPIKAILNEANGDFDLARDALQRAVNQARQDGLTIAAPQSVEKGAKSWLGVLKTNGRSAPPPQNGKAVTFDPSRLLVGV